MADESIGRRRVLRGGGALLSVLPGCGGNIFIEEPTPTRTPDGTGGGGPSRTPTPTPAPTPRDTPTATATLPSDRLELRGTKFSLRLNKFDAVVFVDYEVLIRNVSRRPLGYVEYRVDVRYESDEVSRVVASDYVSKRFPKGLDRGSNALLSSTAKFPRDGRAERSTDEDDLSLEITFREAEFR